MNVSVAEVLAGAVAHAVPLSAECVGYLVLGAADQLLGAPRCLVASDLVLSEEGTVRVAGGRAALAEDAERDLRALLDALLLCSSSASPGLLRASRRPAKGGIQSLVRELEMALIPVNRAAAKRALSRLQRETRRALDSGRIRLAESAPEAVVAPLPTPVASAPTPAPRVVASAPVPVVSAPALPVVEESASEPLPSVALPPVLPPLPSELVPAPQLHEQREQTVMLAEVALREPALPEPPSLVETRPEPVVRRASQRPAAIAVADTVAPSVPDPTHTVPLPPVSAPEPIVAASPPSFTAFTPVLGTRFATEQAVPLAEAAAAHDDACVEAATAEPEPSVDVATAESEPSVDVATAEPEPSGDFATAEPDSSADDELEIVVVEEPTAAEMCASDDDGLEVIFEDDERTVFPEDHELLFAEPEVREAGETTDPCPPLAAESMLPPPCEAVTAAPPPDVAAIVEALSELPPEVAAIAEALSELPPVAPKNETAQRELAASEVEPAASEPELAASEVEPAASESELVASEVEPAASEPELAASEVGLAALVESALPPWSREEAPAFEVTPPPRLALPEPRRSDVQDLLLRLGQAPLGVDELRSGLKRLAGLDLTPPPPGTAPGE